MVLVGKGRQGEVESGRAKSTTYFGRQHTVQESRRVWEGVSGYVTLGRIQMERCWEVGEVGGQKGGDWVTGALSAFQSWVFFYLLFKRPNPFTIPTLLSQPGVRMEGQPGSEGVSSCHFH